MLALGIDPGTAICGYGIVEMKGSVLRPVFYGSILTDKDWNPEERLKRIHQDVSDIIRHFHPCVGVYAHADKEIRYGDRDSRKRAGNLYGTAAVGNTGKNRSRRYGRRSGGSHMRAEPGADFAAAGKRRPPDRRIVGSPA